MQNFIFGYPGTLENFSYLKRIFCNTCIPHHEKKKNSDLTSSPLYLVINFRTLLKKNYLIEKNYL